MNLIVWTLVLCVLMYKHVTEACPSVCRCGRHAICNGAYVDCTGTGLTEVPTNIPANTCYLDLQVNQITTLGDNAFDGLSNLKSLHLGLNKITNIQTNTFNGLPNLQELDMEKNKITVLDKRFFKDLRKLERLAVEDNPLQCDCILAEFVMFAESRNLTLKYRKEPTCSTPSNLTGVLLRDLSSEEMNCDVTTATTPLKKMTSKR